MAAFVATPASTLREIAATYCKGDRTLQDIAKQYGLATQTLRQYSAKYGWGAIRRANRAAAINPKVAPGTLDHQRLYEAQIDFQHRAPQNCTQALTAIKAAARRLAKTGDHKEAGRLWKAYLDSLVTVRLILGIELAEKLKLQEAANGKGQSQLNDPVAVPTAEDASVPEYQSPANQPDGEPDQAQSQGASTDDQGDQSS